MNVSTDPHSYGASGSEPRTPPTCHDAGNDVPPAHWSDRIHVLVSHLPVDVIRTIIVLATLMNGDDRWLLLASLAAKLVASLQRRLKRSRPGANRHGLADSAARDMIDLSSGDL